MTAVSLFAGAGGLDLGFEAAGFEIAVANELDTDIAETYRANRDGAEILNCGIEAVSADMVPHGVDVVIGGPPCQSYSTLGRRQMDGRASLFLEYRRILTIIEPRLFMFENVTGILSMDGGRLFPRVRQAFAEIGYDVSHAVLDAADYGVPQNRRRVIIVGTRGGVRYAFPPPTHGPNTGVPYVTVSDAFGDLPPLKCGESSSSYSKDPDSDFLRYVRDGSAVLTEHSAARHSPRLCRIMEALGDGGDRRQLPLELRPTGGFPNSYAKMWWNRPAPTVTRNFATPSSARCIHPRDSRALTIREGARLQSFPDRYRFLGSDSKKKLMIGNAVPPLLSRALAGPVVAALSGPERGAHGQP